MWGWLDGIVSGLGTIAENIISLPVKLIDGLLDGIKAIFIPDYESLKNTFNATIENISSSLGLHIDSVEDAFESVGSQPVEDITGSYDLPGVGTFNVTFFDTTFFRQGVDYFRPILRGFILLMLIFYHQKMLLSFFEQDAGINEGNHNLGKGENK